MRRHRGQEREQIATRVDPELGARAREMSRYRGFREPELVRDDLVRVAVCGEPEHLLLASRQGGKADAVGLVRPRDQVTAPVAVEVIDERPAPGDERLPMLDRLFGARATEPA